MAQEVRYDPQSSPTKEAAGITNIILRQFDDAKNRDAGHTDTTIGYITKKRGKGTPYTAYINNEDGSADVVAGDTSFLTRSQAGHAILKALKARTAPAPEASGEEAAASEEVEGLGESVSTAPLSGIETAGDVTEDETAA